VIKKHRLIIELDKNVHTIIKKQAKQQKRSTRGHIAFIINSSLSGGADTSASLDE
jgi:hypothetical protein